MNTAVQNKKKDGAIHIAVVDDHHLFRAGLVSLLKDYERLNVVIQAASGKDLFRQLRSHSEKGKYKPLPHVVLLDIQMPEMDGMETTVQLQRDYPNIKIIILTMHNEEEFIFDLMNKGASGFLAKDKSLDMVIDAIHSVRDKGIYFNEQILKAIVRGSQKPMRISDMPLKSFDLSERETNIIQLICEQKTNREIAGLLDLSPRTIEAHRTAIIAKTMVKNTAGLVLFAIKHNLIKTA